LTLIDSPLVQIAMYREATALLGGVAITTADSETLPL
jgi:hypothetical protein